MKTWLSTLAIIGFVSFTAHAQNAAQLPPSAPPPTNTATPSSNAPAEVPHGEDANPAKTVKPETKKALKPLEKAAEQKDAATPEKKKTKKKKKQNP